eukprot:644290-Rhodomonas_salina.1
MAVPQKDIAVRSSSLLAPPSLSPQPDYQLFSHSPLAACECEYHRITRSLRISIAGRQVGIVGPGLVGGELWKQIEATQDKLKAAGLNVKVAAGSRLSRLPAAPFLEAVPPFVEA